MPTNKKSKNNDKAKIIEEKKMLKKEIETLIKKADEQNKVIAKLMEIKKQKNKN